MFEVLIELPIPLYSIYGVGLDLPSLDPQGAYKYLGMEQRIDLQEGVIK